MPPLVRPVVLLALITLASPALSAAATLPPTWSAPSPANRAALEQALASWDNQYDPAEQLVRRPFSSPGYHTALTGGFVHPTRDSLNYALGLLDTGRPERLERAVAIIRRVVSLQDADSASPTYGIWSWFLEEPLSAMRPPDFNWADFNGVTLLQIARDHRRRLPADLAHQVDAAILHACRAIRKRNVGPSYTNIAIMGTYVTLFAGELYQLAEFKEYGLARLKRFYDYTQENGTFEEYNSPTYTVIALLELSRLQAHVRDESAQPLINWLVRRAWEEIALHFHAPTQQWGAPHSRAYSSLTSNSTLALIQRGTGRRVNFGVTAPDREELRLPVACPPDLERHFTTLPAPRTVTQTFIKRTGVVGTTYLHPHFALGSVNRGDLWNQRRALLVHFGSAAAPGYLQLRFLKNGYDFSSAILTSAQREGLVVGAVNVITNGGDTHISLDKVKDAKFRARDLRLRFEVGGPAAAAVRITPVTTDANVTGATIAIPDRSIALSLATARFAGAEGRPVIGEDGKTKWLDVVFHEGEEREFDLAAINEAIVAFALSVGPHGPLRTRAEPDQLTVDCDGLSVTAAIKPWLRK